MSSLSVFVACPSRRGLPSGLAQTGVGCCTSQPSLSASARAGAADNRDTATEGVSNSHRSQTTQLNPLSPARDNLPIHHVHLYLRIRLSMCSIVRPMTRVMAYVNGWTGRSADRRRADGRRAAWASGSRGAAK